MESDLRFRSYDGTVLEGTYCGDHGKSETIVVLVHGITSSRDELGLFSGLAEHLSREGMPSIRFDYRCHGKSKRPIEEMTLCGIINDIEAAARTGLEESNASQVCVVGMSFGGGLSAYWASVTGATVRGVVMLAPVIDYEEDVLGHHGALVDGELSEEAVGVLYEHGFIEMDDIRYGPALINELRFITGAEGLRRLECDALIIHGDADSIVPFSSSERFAGMHERCKLINIPGTDHGFGVGDDEDLSSPETKEKHREVWSIISRFIEKGFNDERRYQPDSKR